MNSITNESSNADVVAWINEHGLSASVPEFHGKIRVFTSTVYRDFTIWIGLHPTSELVHLKLQYTNNLQPADKQS